MFPVCANRLTQNVNDAADKGSFVQVSDITPGIQSLGAAGPTDRQRLRFV